MYYPFSDTCDRGHWLFYPFTNVYAGTDRGVTTFDQCENLCESDTGCYAYDHDTANSKCYTFPTKITASLYSHSDVHHTQSSCNGKTLHNGQNTMI